MKFTVGDLIEALQKQDKNAGVKIMHEYNDKNYVISSVGQDEDPDRPENNDVVIFVHGIFE